MLKSGKEISADKMANKIRTEILLQTAEKRT